MLMIFQALDQVRRQRGQLLDLFGWGARESTFRVAEAGPRRRLRIYDRAPGSSAITAPPLLIIPAPFKRAYIWDLRPEVSVVRRCAERGLRVYLLEWLDPEGEDDFGLEHFADAFVLGAINRIARDTGCGSVILAGHSLGGTFATIFATLHPALVERLWLIDSPLVFADACGGPLPDLVRLVGAQALEAGAGAPAAGSFISHVTTTALPGDFILGPLTDLLASVSDQEAAAIHMGVIRWTLDELSLPRRLFAEVLEQLYRDDQFASGALRVGDRSAGVERLRAPTTAVVNSASQVVPSASTIRGLEASPGGATRVLRYEPEVGCAIQHLGPLVGRRAHSVLWPELLAELTG